MARSLETIQRQIAALQQQADEMKAKEAIGVIERIKTAIDYYGLTAEDLFGSSTPVGRAPKTDGVKARMGRPPKNAVAKAPVAKKSPLPPKYKDEAGNSWSGHGKRPNWFKFAIENGKTAKDLMVKAE